MQNVQPVSRCHTKLCTVVTIRTVCTRATQHLCLRFSILAANTPGPAKDIVNEEAKSRSRVVAWVRLRDRFSKPTGVWSYADTFKFRWSATSSFEDQRRDWLKQVDRLLKNTLCSGALKAVFMVSRDWSSTFVSRVRKTSAIWWTQWMRVSHAVTASTGVLHVARQCTARASVDSHVSRAEPLENGTSSFTVQEWNQLENVENMRRAVRSCSTANLVTGRRRCSHTQRATRIEQTTRTRVAKDVGKYRKRKWENEGAQDKKEAMHKQHGEAQT